MMYKYSLDKSSKKFICPSCGKKTFVKYVEVETNSYLEASIGRCDRESKCSYHLAPNGNKTLVTLSNPVIQPEPSCHDDGVIGAYGRDYKNNQNHFVTYLLKYFRSEDVIKAIKKYHIGTSTYWDGATIFWQVDEQLNVCAGKVMLYDEVTGKRVKQPKVRINWMHRILGIDTFVLQQCLFGMHNIIDYELGKTVCIVESEKTAVILSIIYPTFLWLATGSKSNLKEALLKPLKSYNITLFPDKTEFKDWHLKSQSLRRLGYNIECSDLLEHKNLDEGDDLVDFLNLEELVA
ncbi:DUF6371 domain-containing protein [Flavobacteriaceae bacterium SZ-1-7]|uniref:DUF6371 domain-containing protein n=1 Tax=Tamlana sedimenti TaxID=3134126 RepID=UPI003126D34A